MNDTKISMRDFSPGQQQAIGEAMSALINSLCQAAPRLGPHFLSGGVVDIKTMSGCNMKLGFGPQQGGLILPGGIRPAAQGGRIIKP